jgi:hypothetical protein
MWSSIQILEDLSQGGPLGLQDCVLVVNYKCESWPWREHLLSIQIVVPSDILNEGGIVDKIIQGSS